MKPDQPAEPGHTLQYVTAPRKLLRDAGDAATGLHALVARSSWPAVMLRPDWREPMEPYQEESCVVFSIRGVLGADPARLICYERARRREGLPLR